MKGKFSNLQKARISFIKRSGLFFWIFNRRLLLIESLFFDFGLPFSVKKGGDN